MLGEIFQMSDQIGPPEWAIAGASRLTLDEFGNAFAESWRGVNARLYKLEAWQTYQEPDTKSLRAYENGEIEKVEQLIEEEAEADRFVYEDVRKNGTPFIRLRLVKLPLSKYLEWEFWNYQVRQRLGETIMVIDQTSDPMTLPNSSFFDFLLFDDSVALVHDYGRDGLQVGGWLVTSREALRRLSDVAVSLEERSMPLDMFIKR